MTLPEDDVHLRLAQEAALAGSRPTVAVTHAFDLARAEELGDGFDPTSDLIVVCSACGALTDPGGSSKHELQRLAWRHAEDVHDGDVDREGWV